MKVSSIHRHIKQVLSCLLIMNSNELKLTSEINDKCNDCSVAWAKLETIILINFLT